MKPTLQERIGSLLDDTTTADVTFVVGDEKVSIPAHALVWSTASDSFKAMFFGGFNRERTVELPDASPEGFRVVLQFIYTNTAEINVDNVESVAKLSDKYLLTHLLHECAEWAKNNVSAANVCRFLPWADLYSALSETCWDIALSQGAELLKSPEFLDLPKEILARILASDELCADESTVYARAIQWAKQQLAHDGHQSDSRAIRDALGDLFYLIRFPLFDAEQFANGPAESGLLSDKVPVLVKSDIAR